MRKSIAIAVLLIISWGTRAQFVADFSQSKTTGCAPLIVKFTDASSADANQWTWTSSAGVSSDVQNPTLVFAEPGNFDVTLEATNGAETKTKTVSVRVSPGITVDFSTPKNFGCTPFSAQFNDLSVPQSSAISSWFWSFSNGITSSEQNPTVTFDYAEKVDVLLKITDDNGCEASLNKEEFVTAGSPLANFFYDSIACSLPAEVNFINVSQGENLSYEWSFGNGETSQSEIPPAQTYTKFDTVPVTLYVTESGTSCTDTVEKLMYLRDYEAKMQVSAVCGTQDFSLNLKDLTEPKPTSVLWELGDGSQSVQNEFTHQYDSKAAVTITLTAIANESCKNTASLSYNPPFASFSYTVGNSCNSPYEVNFTNTSGGVGLSYEWEYGDTTDIDTVFEDSHNYVVPPVILSPKLTVVDTFQCVSQMARQILVPIPIADFNTKSEKVSGCAPLTINFIDLSKRVTTDIQELKWDYGDPSSGALNFGSDSLTSHTYNTPGLYDVTLIIILENGCTDTLVKQEFIRVGELPISAAFNINFDDTICFGETLSFEGVTTYSDTNYVADYHCWAFEEGSTGLLINDETPPLDCPESPTNFLVTDDYVHAEIADHQYSNYEYADPSPYNGYNYLGGIIPKDSTLHVHLMVGYNGCYDEVIKPVHVNPVTAMAGFAFDDTDYTLTECDSSRTIGIFNASVNYDSLMYFRIVHEPTSDTVLNIGVSDTVFYKFDRAGDYSIQIGVYNKSTSCQNENSKTFQVIDKNTNIELPASTCLLNELVTVDKSTYSVGNLSQRIWHHDGTIASAAFFPTVTNDTVKVQALDTGWNVFSLDVSLRVSDDLYNPVISEIECPYFDSDSMYVEGATIKLALDTNIACAGDSVVFKNISEGTSPFQSVSWFLKDSTTVLSSSDSLKITYDTPGYYTHSFAATSTFGCIDTVDAPSLLISLPLIDFQASDTVVCLGDPVEFINFSAGNGLSNNWTIESSNYINVNAIHTFSSKGIYNVKLHAIDNYGCEDSATIENYVRVSEIPFPEFYSLEIDGNCPPFTIQLLDSSLTEATEWEWSTSDGGSGVAQNFLHTFKNSGIFDVSLKSTNKDGCAATIKKDDYITVRGPSAAATSNKSEICSPDSVQFNMEMEDVAFFVWDFNDGTVQSAAMTTTSDSVSHLYTKSGVVNPIFTVIDSNDCVVVLNDLPSIAIDSLSPMISAPEEISCNLDSIHFINNSTSHFQSNFKWDFGDGNSSTDSLAVNKYSNPGTYEIKLMMASSIGCLDTMLLSHTLYLGPNESLSVVNPYFCVPTSTTLKLDYNNPGFVAEDAFFTLENEKQDGDSIVLKFSEAKSYNLGYQITYGAGNCLADSIFTHEYYELPVAEFDYSPKNLSLETPQIFFVSSSENATKWKWNFGDGNTISFENPGHSYVAPDNYTVQLIASNEGGCSDTMVTEIPVAPSDIIRLPNAFTPNGDGENDKFGILFAGKMELMSFKVFNRWGNMVFRTGDILEKWDGIFEGKPQNHGTYVYYVKARNEQGNILEYKGNFSLIR